MYAISMMEAQSLQTRQLSAIEKRLSGGIEQRLSDIHSVRAVPPKGVVYYQDEPVDCFYGVIEGVLKLYILTTDGRLQITGFAYPGQFVGFDAGTGYSTAAEAIGHTKLCQYPRAKLEQLVDTHPQLVLQLLAIVSQDLTAARSHAILLGRRSATEKVASFLLSLSQRGEEFGRDPRMVELPMTRGDIGDYLGLTIETVSRVMSRLRQLCVVDYHEPRMIAIRDLARLSNLAEGEKRNVAN